MEEEFAGAMVELVGLHRTDDGQIIGALGQVRQEFGDPRAGLAVLRELVRRRQRSRALGNEGELLALQDAVGHRLAFELREGRLGVEQVDLGRTAEHVQEDHVLGLGGEVRRGGFGCAVVRREERLERDRAQPGRAGAQERSARDHRRDAGIVHAHYPFVIVSSRFRRTRANEVQAAASFFDAARNSCSRRSSS